MRIGILTYSSAHNYGAMLQCYALQEFLKTLGHTVYVIDYRPDYFQYGLFVGWKWISFSPVKTWRKVRFQFHTFKCQRQRYLAFERFSKRYFHLKTLRLSYYQDDIDCFVLGSDQIWRKNRGKFDPVYWGDFEESKGHKFISYAASMG
ncbi:MAG: polysaccharide pyruvyl transferase family protein, partial [Paraprevotella sp.]|nr:polysaccharide pyruvyl transferase family protein [Paraprevotella sp.]